MTDPPHPASDGGRVAQLAHIPLDPVRYGKYVADGETQHRLIQPRCACGHYGRPVAIGGHPDPRTVLAHEHGAPEPIGCAICGAAAPPWQRPPTDPRDRPWRRYRVVEISGTWAYVCVDDHVCRQRQLRAEAAEEAPARTEDPLRWADEQPEQISATLDISGDTLQGATLREAWAHYELGRNLAPRRWHDITQSPAERRTLLAIVTASSALAEAATDAAWHYMLAARKAGATWSDLANASGDWSAEECQAYFIEHRVLDFCEIEDRELRAELEALAKLDT